MKKTPPRAGSRGGHELRLAVYGHAMNRVHALSLQRSCQALWARYRGLMHSGCHRTAQTAVGAHIHCAVTRLLVGVSGLVSFNGYTDSVIRLLREEEAPVGFQLIRLPLIRNQCGAFFENSGAWIGTWWQLSVFKRPAEPIAHNEPTWLVARCQRIYARASSSLGHGPSLPKAERSSANPVGEYWI